jgi:hypothetical protein
MPSSSVRRTSIALACFVTIAVSLAASQAWASAPAASIWTIANSPNIGRDYNQLRAVAATGPSDAWAVGIGRRTPTSQYRTLVTHFDGAAWSLVQSPSVGTSTNELNAVDADSATDAWAVGDRFATPASRTLAEHFDGTRWSVVPTPNVGTANNTLRGVAIVSPSDVWAVGSIRDVAFTPLAMHFDGSSWTVVPTPNPPAGGFFNAVVALASNDVWAVGGTGDDGDDALVEHWNGTAWSIVPAPFLIGEDSFSGVSAGSSSDVWAVGHVGSTTLTEHWNGSAWSVVPSPNPVPTTNGNNFLTAVVEVSPTDVWAVGGTLNFTLGSLRQNVTMRFDGSSWTVVPSPDRGTGDNTLNGVASPAQGSLIAVGSFRPTLIAHDRTLIMTTDQG